MVVLFFEQIFHQCNKTNSFNHFQDSLAAIKGGRVPPPGSMPTFEEIKEILGFNCYYEEEKCYAISSNQMSGQRGENHSATAGELQTVKCTLFIILCFRNIRTIFLVNPRS